MPDPSEPTGERETAPRAEGAPAEELAPADVAAPPDEEPLDLRPNDLRSEERLDITTSRKEERFRMTEAPPYSPEWAKIILPIAMILLGLIATVMLLPFLIIVMVEKELQVDRTLDWAKTVLPPVVGFGGALIGYYFGTRGAQQASPSDDQGDAQ